MRDRIRVGDFETAFLQVLAVIEDRTADEECALWIDNQTHIGSWNKNVAVFGAIHQVHGVLQARAAAADYSQTQGAVWISFLFEQRRQFARRGLGDFDQAFVADLVIEGRGFCGHSKIRKRREQEAERLLAVRYSPPRSPQLQ